MLHIAFGNAQSLFRVYATLSLVSLASLMGCNSNPDLPTAKVTGTITMDGEPVTGGELIFSPVAAGKNGAATVSAEGTFTITTYLKDDGAVVGDHKVIFNPPLPAAEEGPAGGHTPTPVSPYDGMVPSESEITITEGVNELEIELVKKK